MCRTTCQRLMHQNSGDLPGKSISLLCWVQPNRSFVANLAKCWALLSWPVDPPPAATSARAVLQRCGVSSCEVTNGGAAQAANAWRHCVDVITRFSSSRHLDTNGKKTKGIYTDHQLKFGDVWNWRNAKLLLFFGWKNQRPNHYMALTSGTRKPIRFDGGFYINTMFFPPH